MIKGAPASKKDHGFLSIESKSSGEIFLVYRNFMGATHFSALVSPSTAKVKEVEKEAKFQAKVGVSSTGKVHAIISFIT